MLPSVKSFSSSLAAGWLAGCAAEELAGGVWLVGAGLAVASTPPAGPGVALEASCLVGLAVAGPLVYQDIQESIAVIALFQIL